MDEWMDGQTDRKCPYSTGICPLSGLLPCYSPITSGTQYRTPTHFFQTPDIKRGKGTTDHMMPLGDWFSLIFIRRSKIAILEPNILAGTRDPLSISTPFWGSTFRNIFVIFKRIKLGSYATFQITKKMSDDV